MSYLTEVFKADPKSVLNFGLNDEFSKMPTEKIEMPVKSVEDAIKLAADGESEFCKLVDDVMNNVTGAEKNGRIKDTWKIEEKCNRFGISPAELDDVSGKVIICKDVDDLETIARILQKDPHVVRQYDYYSSAKRGQDDGLGTYEIHANYKLSNGLIAEVQIETKMIYVYKSLCWHPAYQVFRELMGKNRTKKDPKIYEILGKLQKQMAENGAKVYKADKSGGKAPYLDIDVTDEDLQVIEENVSASSYAGFLLLVDHKTKQTNSKISAKDKGLVEHLNLSDYLKNQHIL